MLLSACPIESPSSESNEGSGRTRDARDARPLAYVWRLTEMPLSHGRITGGVVRIEDTVRRKRDEANAEVLD